MGDEVWGVDSTWGMVSRLFHYYSSDSKNSLRPFARQESFIQGGGLVFLKRLLNFWLVTTLWTCGVFMF